MIHPDSEAHDIGRIKALRLRAEAAEALALTPRERNLLRYVLEHISAVPRGVTFDEVDVLRRKLA